MRASLLLGILVVLRRGRTCIVASCLLFAPRIGLYAGETITYQPTGANAAIEADLAFPDRAAPGGRFPAVVLLHSAAGWPLRVTEQYAIALNRAGFATLQPRLFYVLPGGARHAQYVPHAYGALAFLVARPNIDRKRVAVAGFSFGGMISIQSAVSESTKRHPTGDLRFAAHAAFYPLCWVFSDLASGKIKGALPAEAFKQWTGVPIRIYAGALDDYDDRDPKMCERFVQALPESQRNLFSVRVYDKATHRWDTNNNESGFNPFACKGRGCTNHNVPNTEVTQRGIADLVAFLSEVLRVTP